MPCDATVQPNQAFLEGLTNLDFQEGSLVSASGDGGNKPQPHQLNQAFLEGLTNLDFQEGSLVSASWEGSTVSPCGL